MGVTGWLAAVDDIDLMQARLDETEHRIGLAVVDDDALTSRDLIGQDERDGAGAIQHVHVGPNRAPFHWTRHREAARSGCCEFTPHCHSSK
jgi:hypothetical protein